MQNIDLQSLPSGTQWYKFPNQNPSFSHICHILACSFGNTQQEAVKHAMVFNKTMEK